MKLLILNALKELINKDYGEEKWVELAENTGLGVDYFTQQARYITEDRFVHVRKKMVQLLGEDEQSINNKFIDYWMTDFAPRVYNFMIKKSENLKGFITGIVKMNNDVCKLFPNQVMSKVDIQETGSNSLTAVYPEEKALVDLIAVLRGASMFFTEKFNMRKINPHSIEIVFEKQ